MCFLVIQPNFNGWLNPTRILFLVLSMMSQILYKMSYAGSKATLRMVHEKVYIFTRASFISFFSLTTYLNLDC